MAFFKVNNVSIRGLAACVPENVEKNANLPFYKEGEAAQVVAAIGIEQRHVSLPGTTASDLCFHAADKLIKDLGWEKESIDLIAFCTQNPDYVNHPNSFVVHDRLGLGSDTMCLDFYHGCPGWVVSLGTVSQLVSGGMIKRAILLDGDTVSKDQDASNREERPLFGDAGTATALEYCEETAPMFFNVGTDSSEGKALARVDGGYRHPFTKETLELELNRLAGKLSPEQVVSKMDSMDVFAFAITKAPKALKKLCAEYEINIEDVDNLVLHQANKMILENIAKRMKMPMEKVPSSLRNYGNTTSASIPLSIVADRQKEVVDGIQKNLVCGFGTGLSWGAAYFETNKIVCSDVVEI